MAFEIAERLVARLTIHVDAQARFTEASAVLFALDFGPFGSDRGSAALVDGANAEVPAIEPDGRVLSASMKCSLQP